MAFKTFAPGVLTSSDVNTFLMRQAVITCTSSTRPSSPSEGMTIYETDTDLYATYTGSAWLYVGGYVDHTPTLGGTGWTFKGHTISSRYARIGNLVHYYGYVEWDGTGSRVAGANPAYVTVPVTGKTGAFYRTASRGIFQQYDQSAGQSREGTCALDASSNLKFSPSMNNAGTYAMNNSATSLYSGYVSGGALVADDSGDRWSWSIYYEAA